MLKSVLRACFGCTHDRTTFPLTPTTRTAPGRVSQTAGAYVVCLDCGREFAYDWTRMRIGEPVRQHEALALEQQIQTFAG